MENMMTNEMSAPVSRWYVRCVDCLSIGAVEANPFGNRWKCGVCAGTIEVMGKVVMNDTKLEKTSTRSACDARCTHAIGPLCVCKCGCVNHGTGRVVTVVIRENIPTIEFQDAETALKIAKDYRAAFTAVETLLSSLSGYFSRSWTVRSMLQKARAARKQETRLKRIAEATTLIVQYQERQKTFPSSFNAPTVAPTPVVPSRVAITGNTYPVKDELKKLGGQWDGLLKAWMIPVANEAAARELVKSAPVKPAFAAIQQQPISDAIPF